MVLVAKAKGFDITSVSRMKVAVNEDRYACTSNLLNQPPTTTSVNDTVSSHVQSIKSLSDHTRNHALTHPPPNTHTTDLVRSADAFYHLDQGEGKHVPEHSALDGDGVIDLNEMSSPRESSSADFGRHTRGRLKRGKNQSKGNVSKVNV